MKPNADISEKTVRQVRIWANLATILPITALAGVFFIWVFGTETLFDIAMAIGATSMFCIAVIWWWWIIYTIVLLVKQNESAAYKIRETLGSIKDIKIMLTALFGPKKDSDKD